MSTTGNDAISYANNTESLPWRTIGRAAWGSTNRDARNGAEAARAGDVVLVAAGTYTTAGTNSRSEIAYYTENSGTAGSPITFRAQGLVNLNLSSGAGPQIGSYRRDYITWDGFTIHEATAPSVPDTGPVTVYACTGCVLQNLDINGNGNANNRIDNHNGIRIESSRDILVRNNRIQNVYTGSNIYNGAAIMTYSSGALTFEHNEIFNCGSGIFIKGGPALNVDYFILRYNLFYNIGETRSGPDSGVGSAIALHAGAHSPADRPIRIYQNIIRNSFESGVRIWAFDSVTPTNNPRNAKIFNNVIDGTKQGLWVSGELIPNAGIQFWNNIVTNTTENGIGFGSSNANNKSYFDSEHNVFFGFTGFAATLLGNYTLATWRTTNGQDAANPQTMTSNPMFVNQGAQDYHLQAGSPARTIGVDQYDLDGDGSTTDIIPAGAYVSGNEVIGRTTVLAPPPQPPRAPTGLRVVAN